MGNAFNITGVAKVIANLARLDKNVHREVSNCVKRATKEITKIAKSNHPEWNESHSNYLYLAGEENWRYHNITYALTESITDMGIIKEGLFDNEIIGQSMAGSSEAFYAEKQEFWHPYMRVALAQDTYNFRDDVTQKIAALVR